MKGHSELFNLCTEGKDKVKVQIALKEKGVFNATDNNYICIKCKKSLESGKMPKFCFKNGLNIDKVPEYLRLTKLESNLIAKNILFQKFHKKAKSRWSGTHDRLINIPITNDAILHTVESLP